MSSTALALIPATFFREAVDVYFNRLLSTSVTGQRSRYFASCGNFTRACMQSVGGLPGERWISTERFTNCCHALSRLSGIADTCLERVVNHLVNEGLPRGLSLEGKVEIGRASRRE